MKDEIENHACTELRPSEGPHSAGYCYQPKESAKAKKKKREPEKTYSEKLKDPRWQRKRLEVLQAADFTCEDCSNKEETLEVHHCCYVKGREPWDYTLNSLMCLCSECHESRQEAEKSCKNWFAVMLRFSSPQAIEKWDKRLRGIVVRIPKYNE